MLTYMDRLLEANLNLDREAFEFLHWLLKPNLASNLVRTLRELTPAERRQQDNEANIADGNSFDFAYECSNAMKWLSHRSIHRARIAARQLIEMRMNEIGCPGPTVAENNILEFRKIFHLDDLETEFCVFLLIMVNWTEFNAFFERNLHCNRYQGRGTLALALNCRESEVAERLSGRLNQIGLVEKDYADNIVLEPLIRQQLENLNPGNFRTEFIKPLRCDAIPLDAHMIEKSATTDILTRLRYEPETSTHVLLYGPPGTGKTSYAYAIATELGLTCYQLIHGEEKHGSRRAATAASLYLASEMKESILVADDCDSILNTRNSWTLLGETHDKRWLHEILEKPVVRMIWIANSVDGIEESVARRFSFSVNFKPFNRQQRVQLWNNVVIKHQAQDFLGDSDVEELASRFDVSAGVIDQAVRKVAESSKHSDDNLRKSVVLALESHVRLQKGGHTPVNKKWHNDNFVLEGLNLSGTDAQSLLEEMTAFNEFSKEPDAHDPLSMSLLFHGPPGTGKSALARFIATHLDREIVFKRASDLFSKWVGDTEQNIRSAYEEAQAKEAILIFDEADSLVFNRDRAERSWELSFTNEFLTWMESFEGVQIFTTNRLKDMDNASLRRFNHKIEFGYLKPEGNVIFYEKLIAPLTRKSLDNRTTEALKELTGLTPGDFKAVRDRFAFRNKKDVTHKALVAALENESRLKMVHSGQKSVGF